MIKIYSQYSEFRASASCSKIADDKNCIFNTVKILRTSASCSKILNGKKFSMQCIQCIFTWGDPCYLG